MKTTNNSPVKQETKAPNKKERRSMQLERHYKALEILATICGVQQPNGKKLSVKLLGYENLAHKITTNQCNGVGNREQQDRNLTKITFEIENTLFNGKLQGFFINGDARGYALKIKDGLLKTNGIYENCGLQRDWGGYGLLAPLIDGD